MLSALVVVKDISSMGAVDVEFEVQEARRRLERLVPETMMYW